MFDLTTVCREKTPYSHPEGFCAKCVAARVNATPSRANMSSNEARVSANRPRGASSVVQHIFLGGCIFTRSTPLKRNTPPPPPTPRQSTRSERKGSAQVTPHDVSRNARTCDLNRHVNAVLALRPLDDWSFHVIDTHCFFNF